MSDAKRHYLEDDQPMTSELAKKHTKFDELMAELMADPARREDMERARIDVRNWIEATKERYDHVYSVVRNVLIEEFRENLEIKAPGPLADATAKALTGYITRMLDDKKLTAEIPMSTVTKVEM